MKYFLASGLLIVLAIGALLYYYKTSETHLEGFYTLTSVDPLFYSPVMGADFGSAVTDLTRAEADLKVVAIQNIKAKNAPYTKTYASMLEVYPLFPTGFLATLPAIATSTEKFLVDPTFENARNLLALYEDAAKQYAYYASSTKAVFTQIDTYLPANKPLFYFFTDTATSKTIAKADADLIYKNSQALIQEIQRRKSCLEIGQDCSVLEKTRSYTLPPQVPLNPNADTDFVRTSLEKKTNDKITGPYTVSSSCWESPHSGQQQMYLLHKEGSDSSNSFVLPKLATTNYYRTLATNTFDIIGKTLIERGVSFYYQPEGTTYECTDLTFYATLLTLEYLNTYATTLDDKKRAKIIENQFGLLAPALRALAVFTDVLTLSQTVSHDFVLSPQFLFSTRSAYSLTYLPFARSVWRISEVPQYQTSRNEYKALNPQSPFVTLTTLRQAGVTDEALENARVDQREILEHIRTSLSPR